ncbi:nucleotidyl transferase AbiEii/AbiGii toxin family protein [Picosynechococcus sp. PCC 73109]|uniref:nucleotidyl transferase AbiEii/AbiGii toxin family protein n=1 Tax=Picosynechococcus sp. PCC 73109 TaxID=374982 RepID=UPI000745826D|nr:nucleotidyl transferase AbiEii/AbiGii toxin family protein [Picosynechococcus sp. PCC 73109]AMA10664.1 hypothetical protein AWQ23_14545 [Picosynechococcus sp. PCC 73109]
MSNKAEIIDIIQAIAAELVVDECFIEKDWYAMRIIGILSEIQDPIFQLVFSGGTSLSKGFGLIQRFSEDLDFKVQIIGDRPSSKNQEQKRRKAFRETVLDVLDKDQTDWQVDRDALLKGNGSSFFKVPIRYQPQFEVSQALRPYVQLEVTFESPCLDPLSKPLQSFVGQALQQEPEAIAFPCVDPVETAADKLSALVWRIRTRDRSSDNDDPTLVRHLHDLGALMPVVKDSGDFPRLVRDCLVKDQNRGHQENAITDPKSAITFLVGTFEKDSLYQQEYERFVEGMSYAEDAERLNFAEAIAHLRGLQSLF